jgi:shikimate 5-dehydrogenase
MLARMEKLCDSCCHIYINCTSVGMSPKVEASPIDRLGVEFAAGTVVFDTIYNPMKTKFLRETEGAGAKVISGVEMFVRQAGRQFEEWVVGKVAPVEVMRRVVEGRLSR